ncbi:hypothetical protein [Cellvibrio mixtus]|uniref:hypothetical protein n=1 Tax=Cellvibrio mixtus TaxID=39650 RepID=UPI0005869E4B|nr:hypothetical protein [Cellvibrio mixtus]
MLDKMKDLGSQALIITNDAIGAVTTSVTSSVDSLNEKAVRASTAQMYRILEIALEELKGRPLADQLLSLTSSINVGVAALELQIHLNGDQEPRKLSDSPEDSNS